MTIPSWARIGAKVVYIRKHSFPRHDAGITYPQYGDRLTIRDVVDLPDGRTLLRLVEIVNPVRLCNYGYMEGAFGVKNFSPIVSRTQEQDIALFAPLLDVTDAAREASLDQHIEALSAKLAIDAGNGQCF